MPHYLRTATSTYERLAGKPNARQNRLLSAKLGRPLKLRSIDLIDDNEALEVTSVDTSDLHPAQADPAKASVVAKAAKTMDFLQFQKRKTCASTPEESTRAVKKVVPKTFPTQAPPKKSPSIPSRYTPAPKPKPSPKANRSTDDSSSSVDPPKLAPGFDRPKIVVTGFVSVRDIQNFVRSYGKELFHSADVFQNRASEICYTLSFATRKHADDIKELINNESEFKASEFVSKMVETTTVMLRPASHTPLRPASETEKRLPQRGDASATVSSGRLSRVGAPRNTSISAKSIAAPPRPTSREPRKELQNVINFSRHQKPDVVVDRDASERVRIPPGPDTATRGNEVELTLNAKAAQAQEPV